MPNQHTDEDRRKIREFHRDKALTRRAGRKYVTHKVALLENDELIAFIDQRIKTIYAEALDGRNHKLMTAANELDGAWIEARSRGGQLSLPLDLPR